MKQKFITKLSLSLIALVTILLAACTDFTSSKRNNGDEYVISGVLYVNEYVTANHPIFVGKTATIHHEQVDLSEMIIEADTILVTLTEMESRTTIYLELNIPQTYSPDSLGFYDSANALLIKPEHHYKIETIIINDDKADTVWAVTKTPAPYDLLADSVFTTALPQSDDDYPELKYDTANTEHPLRILAGSDSTVAIKFRFYCLEEYNNAYYIQDYPGVDDVPEDQDEYESPGDGSPRKIEWYYIYNPELMNDQYVITDRGYKGNLVFYGKYEISVYALDTNYYQYLYKQEGYRHGGIRNGIGYFGSVSGRKLYTKIIE